jgi:LacI family transcriptional regulator
MAGRANIRQVAKAAGVSIATVSGVLNDTGRHSPETAARVRRVMQQLGYVPRRNRRRRKAADGKVAIRRVGVLVPDREIHSIQTPLAVGLAEGVQKVLAEQNVHVTVLTLRPDGGLPAAVTRGELDGLVVRSGSRTPEGDEGLRRDLEAAGIPTVWTFGSMSASPADAVRVDDRACGIWGADRALASGCRHALVVRPAGERNIDIEFRALAFELRLRERGFPAERISAATTDALSGALKRLPVSSVATFVPGHDADVLAAHERFAKRVASKRGRDTLIAVMTDDIPGLTGPSKRVRVLHIDPHRIGMAAGRQILWRRRNPWAEPARLLVPAKELMPTSAGNRKERRA